MLQTINEIEISQKNFFNSGATLSLKFRVEQLKKLKLSIKKYEAQILKALHTDLGKSEFEAFTNEVGLAQKELTYHIKMLRKWAKPKKVSSPLFIFPSTSYITKQPFGRILIIGPFNFPFMLTVVPLIGAISAGNVAVIKPSENTPATSAIIEKMMVETFPEKYVSVIQGGIETNQQILTRRWDKIFFTGSSRVGKIVMEAAAKFLTPVELELGGKNPVVVDYDANLKVAAKRIIWGKMLNAGQSCVAPDYLFVHEKVKEEFLLLLKKNIILFFQQNPQKSPEFGRIVNPKTVQRLEKLLENQQIYFGGESDSAKNYMAPTLVTNVKQTDKIMQEEIFGPILPVLSFSEIDVAIAFINENEKPLAAYYFSENREKQKIFLARTFSGDASINEVVIHFTNFALPFGGVGFSGMGAYHGKHSFDCFSHTRSVVKTPAFIDLPFRYPPVKSWVLKLMRFLMK